MVVIGVAQVGFVGVFPQGWKVESLSGYKSADIDQNTRGIL